MPKEIKKITKVKTPAVKKAVVKKDIKKVEVKAVSKVIETPKVEVSHTKIAKYFNKDLMISPRKLRLLADNIRKLSPVDALARLKFTNTKSARIMIKALQNVIADAKNNFNLDTNTLKFDLLKVDEGLKMKRMDKAHGSRFARGLIQKRHSRLIIHVKGNQK
ncbi:MAG: uL22 family ribosomal protein [Candidatus Shapirobacteria bacterium]|nr:uL22 family ribosomal protein [Candidatus Shapirobacteria bacterium]MDD4410704.1 uL22 family ribosomal protein [Candidatus Shapirobacteria bacterium]